MRRGAFDMGENLIGDANKVQGLTMRVSENDI
jgi:hypothetical protein